MVEYHLLLRCLLYHMNEQQSRIPTYSLSKDICFLFSYFIKNHLTVVPALWLPVIEHNLR